MDALVGTHELSGMAATQALAARFAHDLTGGSVLLLLGDLGSGKTAFTQALAAALGIPETVTSPTFTIAAQYPVPSHPSIRQLVHVDLYRLTTVAGADLEHIQDVLDSAKQERSLVVIEWAERLPEQPANAWQLRFTHGIKPTERIVKIEKPKLRNPKSETNPNV